MICVSYPWWGCSTITSDNERWRVQNLHFTRVPGQNLFGSGPRLVHRHPASSGPARGTWKWSRSWSLDLPWKIEIHNKDPQKRINKLVFQDFSFQSFQVKIEENRKSSKSTFLLLFAAGVFRPKHRWPWKTELHLSAFWRQPPRAIWTTKTGENR